MIEITMRRLGIAGCLLWAIGCGPRVAPVSGIVTLDGDPLPGATITFEPLSGEPGQESTGRTDESGSFALARISNGKPGALVGEHRVHITTISTEEYQDERSRMPKDRVPTHYQDGSLKWEVPANGSETANFDLISRRR